MNGVKEVGMAFYGNVPSSTDVFQFPNLDELEVDGCKEVILRSKSNLQSLTKLKISNISGLESLNGIFLEALVSLQGMFVFSCDYLKHLWDDEFNVRWLGCLKNLSVWWCKKLEKLPIGLHSLTSLTYLTVIGYPSLKTFPTRGLPYSVKHVRVWECDSLESRPEGIIVYNSNRGQMCQIEVLRISGCSALILPSNLGFPALLRDLNITGPLLFRSLQLQNGLSHLTFLSLGNCPNLESFPDTTPPMAIPTLLSLYLSKCEKLRSLPNHIKSLQTLKMNDCPEIASFPEGGPTNLKQLELVYCDKLESKVMLEQSLNSLTCLQRLVIKVGVGMDDVHSFPYDSLLLPTSLTRFKIRGFQNLKSMTRGIQTLTSLQELRIEECPQLQSLPTVGPPPSLELLQIYRCPILEKQCRKGKGDFWPIVASIPANGSLECFSVFDKPQRLWK